MGIFTGYGPPAFAATHRSPLLSTSFGQRALRSWASKPAHVYILSRVLYIPSGARRPASWRLLTTAIYGFSTVTFWQT